ncbi:double-stranded RNA-binding protein 1 isoform X1 [Morus notabilis]|uniref:double-stranded RNA-binding protein 1 isoform X1 n=1 Tax=Morus notabilis TaxID=981085 RepID=UPI000CECE88E|nr:double-stranded RNA-binding protein 1 isoform X1 [Morus notabilis]XP_024020410.1 double-stranded RNA-binding protein 1 isoform X1 [Morus notabilis]XP_024020411.1 double-stranded RNA-binding protein 1 isoform X1 [Morus notabilis]
MSQQQPHCQATIIMPDAQPLPQLSFRASASMPQTQTQAQAQAHTNYADQALIPFPTPQPPAPALFRATVLVDGAKYTSQKTFSTCKAAEQDVAKLTPKYISQKKHDDGFPWGFPDALPLIHKDTVFCKSILNEFATKMNMEMPTYNTIKPEGLLPVFNSSLVFNGVSYTGGAGKNKKEAERLVARTIILSLLGDSRMGRVLYDIIKSKVKLYAALHKVSNLSTVPSMANMTHCSEGVSGKDVGAEASLAANNALTAASSLPTVVDNAAAGAVPDSGNGVPTCKVQIVGPQPSFGVNNLLMRATQATEFPIAVPDSGNRPPKHEFKAQEPEHSFGANNQHEPASQATKLPIQFVHPTSALFMETGPSSKKRRKNKKKANKRLCTGAH